MANRRHDGEHAEGCVPDDPNDDPNTGIVDDDDEDGGWMTHRDDSSDLWGSDPEPTAKPDDKA